VIFYMRIGSHLSISKGLDKAARLAQDNGANLIQFFTRNPRGGAARKIEKEEINRWIKIRSNLDMHPLIGHLPYTVDLASAQGRPLEFARMVVHNDLVRMGEIEAELVISHPGRHNGDEKASLQRVAELLIEVLGEIDPEPVFCFETMALQGRELGSVEQLGWLIKAINHPKVGVCLDSAHLFAAGWDLSSPEGCRLLVDTLDKQVGLDRVKCMHLNDSKAALGSYKDRHANIGNGYLGREGITAIVNDEFLGSLPLVLETPAVNYRDYAAEIALVKSLI